MKQTSSPATETKTPLWWFCGLAAGALNLGMGSILALTVLELVAGRQPQFHDGQRLSMVAAGALFGLILAPAFVQTRRYLQGGAARQGGLFGLMLLALLLMVVAPVVLTRDEESLPWLVACGAVFAAAAFTGYGTMLATALDEPERPPARAAKCCGPRVKPCLSRKADLLPFSNSNN